MLGQSTQVCTTLVMNWYEMNCTNSQHMAWSDYRRWDMKPASINLQWPERQKFELCVQLKLLSLISPVMIFCVSSGLRWLKKILIRQCINPSHYNWYQSSWFDKPKYHVGTLLGSIYMSRVKYQVVTPRRSILHVTCYSFRTVKHIKLTMC